MEGRSQISPFTLVRGTRGALAPGQLFNTKEYRKLMAIMVIETNSSFALVASNSFGTLMAYCNGAAITISRRTRKCDMQSILYKDLFETLRVRLQDHIFTSAKINLTIDAWTSAKKLPFLGITAHWIDMGYERFNTLVGFERLRGFHTVGVG